jgi:hypothetical protein
MIGNMIGINRRATGPGVLAWLILAPRAAIFSTRRRRNRS